MSASTPMNPSFSQLVVLEGGIGAGKTTFARACAAEPGLRVNGELEMISDVLKEAFYEDPDANAFGTEIAMGVRRYERLRFYASHSAPKDRRTTLLIDRSLVGSLAFAALSFARSSLSERQYMAVVGECGSAQGIDAALALMPLRSSRPILVHMRTEPAQCLKNIHLRGSADAKSITLEYLYELAAAHELAFLQLHANAVAKTRYDLVEISWSEYVTLPPSSVLKLVRKRAAKWRKELSDGTLPSLVTTRQLHQARDALDRLDNDETRSRLIGALLENSVPALAKMLL